MDGRIGQFNCRFKLVGGEQGRAMASTLDRLAAARLADAYASALDSFLEGDDSVYVIRRVDLSLDVLTRSGPAPYGDDRGSAMETRLGQRMANAVTRKIVDGSDVVRFENQADYLARFIYDLLAGSAWESWLYGAFAHLHHLPLSEALRQALLAQPEYSAETLRRLLELYILERVLAALGAQGRRSLWVSLAYPAATDARAALELARPFLAAAISLASSQQMWNRAPPRLDDLAAFLPGAAQAYWLSPDWSDAQSLAAAVLAALRLLASLGYLHRPPAGVSHAAWETALGEFDWLDAAWLLEGWNEILRDPLLEGGIQTTTQSAPLEAPSPPARLRGPATPRQKRLLQALLSILEAGDLRLDAGQPASPANALRLLAALGEKHPQMGGDSLAPHLISRLLAAWEALASAASPGEAFTRLQRGDLDGALRLLPLPARSEAAALLDDLHRLGEAALQPLAALLHAAPAALSGSLVEMRCAGAAFLLRAVSDARLPALLAICSRQLPGDLPANALNQVLLSLLEAWAGAPEAGLRIIAGLPAEPAEELRDGVRQWMDSAAYTCFCQQVVAQAQGLGLADHLLPPEDWSSPPAELLLLWGEAGAAGRNAWMAGILLRLWSRWLRGFSASGPAYLLENFIRRPGRLRWSDAELVVELEPRPLDVVLETADYLAPVESAAWLGGRRIVFKIQSDPAG